MKTMRLCREKVVLHERLVSAVYGGPIWVRPVRRFPVYFVAYPYCHRRVGVADAVLAGAGGIVYSYFRILSRNTRKRYSENLKYLSYQNRVTTWFGKQQVRFKQRKDYHYYRCPQCGQQLRVPRGRGKISITCPKCGHQFIKKS